MEVSKINGRFRFCAFQTYDGVRRHYICGHHEYCCALGCCVSTSFSFYQLWYFWLLLLLMILVCSGGGWWYRWRNGHFQRTPATRRRRTRGQGRNARVYPSQGHQYPTHAAYSLPDDVDKDPPPYNEVVRHLNSFPPASSVFGAHRTSNMRNGDSWSTGPPPSYEMVLDLKRKKQQIEREIREEEQSQSLHEPPVRPSTRDRIRSFLRIQQTSSTIPPNNNNPVQHPFFISSAASSPPLNNENNHYVDIPPTLNNMLDDRDTLSPPRRPQYTPQVATESMNRIPPPPFIISRSDIESGYSQNPSDARLPDLGSSNSITHSDYSSTNLGSSLSLYSDTETRFLPPIRSSPYIEDVDDNSTFEEPRPATPNIPREDLDAQSNRPNTTKSFLSRPSTSISVRSIPNSQARRTSLPGALSEADENVLASLGENNEPSANEPPTNEQTVQPVQSNVDASNSPQSN